MTPTPPPSSSPGTSPGTTPGASAGTFPGISPGISPGPCDAAAAGSTDPGGEAPAATEPAARRLVVLGSTGSIGTHTLTVAEHLRDREGQPIEVVALAAGRSVDKLIAQARQCKPRFVAIAEPSLESKLARALPKTRVFAGEDAARRLVVEAVEQAGATDLASAIVGAAGLAATLAGAKRGMRVHLANKETLVAAGALVAPAVREGGGELLPVDSEHSAIFQCLDGQPRRAIRRIVLTASGGPFRTADRAAIESATVDQALAHPTWKMGPKITIDSATMMNKALEVIEAHWLFGLPGEQIEVIVHPQSIVHSFVEFADRCVLAQMGPPDMKTPIHYALTYPHRRPSCSRAMDWSALRELTFEPPDHQRFPALKLAHRVIEAGGTAGAVLNAANEAAVAAFLAGHIRFGRITALVAQALDAIGPVPVTSLGDVAHADASARRFVQHAIGRGEGR